MTTQEQKKAGYITLKEASDRFGYSPDYIGQLIRKGKLEGKQVYANVAWMTTPAAMEEYLSKEKRTGKGDKEKEEWTSERMMQEIFLRDGSRTATWFLSIILGILGVLLLCVFYFLSVAFEHKLNQRANERLLKHSPSVTVRSRESNTLARDAASGESLIASLQI